MQITLQAARVNLGLTRSRAAQMLGVTPRALQNYESGYSMPRADLIKRMLALYGVAFDDLNFCPKTTIK